jgi:hypothetical protein
MPAAQQYNNITSRLVKGLFFEALDATQSWANDIVSEFSSDQSVETYAGLTNAPMLREWIGGRQKKQVTERTLSITNKDWESTLEIATKDLRRDKTDQIRNRIAQLAQRAVQHKEKLISQLIAAGDATTYGNAYTGTTFFSSSHSYGSSTNDNTIDVDISALPTGDTTGSHGSTTAPSVGEMALSIQQGVQQLYGFVDSEGEPINQNVMDFTIMVPTTLWAVAQTAISKDYMAQGMSNPIVGSGLRYKVVANARINAFTTKFVVFASGGLVRPFIVQTEVAPSISALAEGSDYEFQNKAHLYAVDWTGNVGYYAPDKAVLVAMT